MRRVGGQDSRTGRRLALVAKRKPAQGPYHCEATMSDGAATISLSEVRCQQQLGGLLKHYYRQAA
jgi:hypothetical protein